MAWLRPAPCVRLAGFRQRGGKWVAAFALEGDFEPAALRSNSFEIEWPPRSGRIATFPEIDRVRWFPLALAREAILVSQRELLDRLARELQEPSP